MPYEYKVKEVVRVVDGDTVDIIIDLGFDLTKRERVRVGGVDTPEKRTRNKKEKMLGLDATSFAEEWFAKEGDVVVKTSKDGKYGRMIGFFWRGEDDCFNQELIDLGYAWEYDGGTKIEKDNEDFGLDLLALRGFSSWEEYSEGKS